MARGRRRRGRARPMRRCQSARKRPGRGPRAAPPASPTTSRLPKPRSGHDRPVPTRRRSDLGPIGARPCACEHCRHPRRMTMQDPGGRPAPDHDGRRQSRDAMKAVVVRRPGAGRVRQRAGAVERGAQGDAGQALKTVQDCRSRVRALEQQKAATAVARPRRRAAAPAAVAALAPRWSRPGPSPRTATCRRRQGARRGVRPGDVERSTTSSAWIRTGARRCVRRRSRSSARAMPGLRQGRRTDLQRAPVEPRPAGRSSRRRWARSRPT